MCYSPHGSLLLLRAELSHNFDKNSSSHEQPATPTTSRAIAQHISVWHHDHPVSPLPFIK